MSDLHIVYTETGEAHGWTIESPQLPDLIGGNNSITDLVAETGEIVQWAKHPDDVFDRTFGHEQHLVADPHDRQFLIRWQFDNGEFDRDYDARRHTAERLNYAISNGLITGDELAPHPVLHTTGERLFIVVLATDTLGWMMDQLSERTDCCVLAQHLEDGAIINIPFRHRLLPTAAPIEYVGLTRDSTFTEMVDAVLAREVSELRKTTIPAGATSDLPRHIPDRLAICAP